MTPKLIGDVCEVIAGQSPKSSFYNKDGDGLPFYQGKKEFSDKYIGKPTTWTTKVTKEAFKDDILMSVRAPVGPVNYATEHMCIGRGLAAIRAGKEIDKEYLFYFLIHHENQIVGNIGAVFNSINKKQIENLEILLPETLKEQKQIVSTLDKAFKQIDQAKANLEQNLHNAKELFQSKLNEVFSQRGEGWVEKRLNEITTKLGDGLHGTPKYTEDGEYYFINGNNLDNGKIIFKDKTKRVSVAEYEKYKKPLNNRTVFVSINGTLGNVAFYNNEKIMLGKSACYFNLIEEVDKEFIKYFIQNPSLYKYLHTSATGATIKNVSLKTMRGLKINLPSLKKQNEIVKELDKFSTLSNELQNHYQQKLNNLEELKKSILQKAFRGELT